MSTLLSLISNLIILMFITVFCFGYSKTMYAAPCCARNSATPALIVGDNESQVNVGFSVGYVVAEVGDDGVPVFGSPGSSDISRSYRLDAATLLSDRFQLGLSLSMVNHGVEDAGVAESYTGFGDARISIGYEAVTVWNYSKWRPQVFLFGVAAIPFGRSKYETQFASLSDVTGNGFFSFSVGALVLKRFGDFDVFLMPEGHYSLPRLFNNNGQYSIAAPGFGGSIGIGGGYSPGGGNFRFGIRVQPRWDQTTTTYTRFSVDKIGSILSVCDTGFDISYLLNTNNTIMLSYSDQTLLGTAANLNLNRVIAFNFQHRWER